MADNFRELPGGLESPEFLRQYLLEILERISLLEEKLEKLSVQDK